MHVPITWTNRFFHRKSMYWSTVGLLFIIHTNSLGLAICKAEFYFRMQLERCNYFVLADNSCCHRKGCYRLMHTLRIVIDSYSHIWSLLYVMLAIDSLNKVLSIAKLSFVATATKIQFDQLMTNLAIWAYSLHPMCRLVTQDCKLRS